MKKTRKEKEIEEDKEMYNSKNYKKNIAISRASKKIYTNTQVRKMLGL
jgi:hypothetical protein